MILHKALKEFTAQRMGAYKADPGSLREHFGIEETVLAGGYGYRQILELVQNGADALLEAGEGDGKSEGRIHVQLHGSRLYVANTGAPLSKEGLETLLRSHASPKRGNQIGRFGLGFKSLLRLNGRIDIFTRKSGAIRFDPERCRAELRDTFQVSEAPGLRLAWPLRSAERKADPLCSELSWAETIIRVEIGSEMLLEHLRQEIRSFPAEFLLFFKITTLLSLDDGVDKAREVRLDIKDSEHILHDGDAVSRWRIATTEASDMEERAVADATHIHARDSVPVSWAMPLEGRREEVGRFWAFFPTQTQTYLPGILNAPWKLNSDRNAIISGEWNSALMRVAAQLIADTLPGLSTPDDPARPLDAFPRQPDRKDVDAEPLLEELWNLLKIATIIPDGTGSLRNGKDLFRHPENVWRLLADAWQSLAGTFQQRQLVHAACLKHQRASRLNSLAELIKSAATGQDPSQNLPTLQCCSINSWFHCVASVESETAFGVLKLAETFSKDTRTVNWKEIRPKLKIIPTQSGELDIAENVVFVPEGTSMPGRTPVASGLQSNPEARRILRDVFQVREPDDGVWKSVLLESLPLESPKHEADWLEFWSRLRSAPEAVRKAFLEQHRHQVHVRRRDECWVTADCALLPGGLISDNDRSSNANILIDLDLHGKDRTSLELLGVVDVPTGGFVSISNKDKPILDPWINQLCWYYWYNYNPSASRDYLEPGHLLMPRSYSLLNKLTGIPNVSFTLRLLNRLSETEFLSLVTFGHRTVRRYPDISVAHPLSWYLLSFGKVKLGDSIVPLKAFFARRSHEVLRRLPNWGQIGSAIGRLNIQPLTVDVTPADLKAFWGAIIDALVTPELLDGDELTDLWLGAGNDRVIPTELPTSTGPVPLSTAFVTTSASAGLARHARTSGFLVVVLAPITLQRWLAAGAQDLERLVQVEWSTSVGTPERMTDVIPELSDVLRPEWHERACCQRVKQLHRRIADEVQQVPCLMWNGMLLLDAEQLQPLSRAKKLQLLLCEIDASGWLHGSATEAHARLVDHRVEERRTYVAQGETLVNRLLRAVGDRPEPLLEALGQPLRDLDFVRRCTPPQLAELVLAHLGPSALTVLQDTLKAEGLKPPARWNTAAALAFAAAIHFPSEFASSSQAKREPEELISGPIELPPLHDFQQEVLDSLSSLLASGTQRRRAVISLPTGGGKTRVTVEAAVRLVLVPAGDRRSVLWIAQTDELCEQAVQAFRQVWVNLGARRTDLRIARLWGGNPNPTEQDVDKPVVVVASIQTLNKRLSAADLAWLRKPGLVVVDECHHAITSSYSDLLRWLDAEAPHSGASEQDEPAIVGLSATPFRNDDDESQRLARRFDSRWLPSDQERLHERLLAQGVLARAQYEPLDSGVGLTEDELVRLGQLSSKPWEGFDFENLLEAINQRLAGDMHRNKQLMKCIETSAARSILFFANSVNHAQEISARLNLAGIEAAAISSSTPPAARRYFLERFQGGQIRVLCNHSVLTTGFDAPKTDMVLIARQVFSRVRYMQMVGRGLRGEKNGGTHECRIVTVMDNLGRFEDRHPYHYFRDLYASDA